MARIKTSVLIEKTVEALVSIGLSKRSVSKYKTDFRLVGGVKEGCVYFSVARVQRFTSNADKRLRQKQISKRRHAAIRKAASLLCEMYNTDTIQWGRLPWRSKKVLGEEYAELLGAYITAKTAILSHKTTTTYSGIIKTFLLLMEKEDHANFDHVDLRTISIVLTRMADSYTASMDSVLVALRSFFTFLNEEHLIHTDIMPALMLKPVNRRTVIRGFSSTDISRIMNTIDHEKSQGKRDYAILTIGLYTGLRGVDVVNLTFDNIDWERDALKLVQSKTGKSLNLHLEPAVGNAIADYLLHGRPDKSCNHIFLSTKAPYSKLAGIGSVNDFLYSYMDKAGVSHLSGERKGFHSFRRALATDLLEADVEPAIISNVLGQANPNSLRSYLSLNQSKLKDCALSLEGFSIMREELV